MSGVIRDCLTRGDILIEYKDEEVVAPSGRHQKSRQSWYADGAIQVWDLERGSCIVARKASRMQLTWALSPDGRWVVSHTNRVERGTMAFDIWDLDSGDIMGRCATPDEGVRFGDVNVSPDGHHVVYGDSDGAVRIWDLLKNKEIAWFTVRGMRAICRWSPGGRIVAADSLGYMYFLIPNNIESGPTILTAWRSLCDDTFAFGCPHCRVWSEIPESALGTELPCPHCDEPVRLNPFTIDADWRPVAATWRGE